MCNFAFNVPKSSPFKKSSEIKPKKREEETSSVHNTETVGVIETTVGQLGIRESVIPTEIASDAEQELAREEVESEVQKGFRAIREGIEARKKGKQADDEMENQENESRQIRRVMDIKMLYVQSLMFFMGNYHMNIQYDIKVILSL